MSNPNYQGVPDEVLIQKLRDLYDEFNTMLEEFRPTGSAANGYFADDIQKEILDIEEELIKHRGLTLPWGNVNFEESPPGRSSYPPSYFI